MICPNVRANDGWSITRAAPISNNVSEHRFRFEANVRRFPDTSTNRPLLSSEAPSSNRRRTGEPNVEHAVSQVVHSKWSTFLPENSCSKSALRPAFLRWLGPLLCPLPLAESITEPAARNRALWRIRSAASHGHRRQPRYKPKRRPFEPVLAQLWKPESLSGESRLSFFGPFAINELSGANRFTLQDLTRCSLGLQYLQVN
jgi:hypothetical protein